MWKVRLSGAHGLCGEGAQIGALGGQCIRGAGESLLLGEELLAHTTHSCCDTMGGVFIAVSVACVVIVCSPFIGLDSRLRRRYHRALDPNRYSQSQDRPG